MNALTGILHVMREVRMLRWAVIFLGLLTLGLGGGVRAVDRQSLKIQKKKQELQERVAKIQEHLTDAEAFEQRLNARRQELENLKAKTLIPGEQAEVISLLTQTTHDLGISIINIKAVASAQPPSPKKIDPSVFEIEVACPFRNLGAFFETLAQAPLLLTVEEFETQPDGTDLESLKTKMTLAAYEDGTAK